METGTPAQYLRNLMKVPVMYGTDQGDSDALRVIADKIEELTLADLKEG